MTIEAYIGFGSNLGDRETTFDKAEKALALLADTTVEKCSSLYESEPQGLNDGGPRFLNAVIAIETRLSPFDLMAKLVNIERELGKSPFHRSYMSRFIDLDLLLYGDEHFQENGLEIPHPRMHNRAFVLVPLAQIAPHVMHPVLKCSIEMLLSRLPFEHLGRVVPLEKTGGSKTKC